MRALIDVKSNAAIDPDLVKPANDAVAALAYQLWEGRGRPIGSPDEDWFIAERELTVPEH